MVNISYFVHFLLDVGLQHQPMRRKLDQNCNNLYDYHLKKLYCTYCTYALYKSRKLINYLKCDMFHSFPVYISKKTSNSVTAAMLTMCSESKFQFQPNTKPVISFFHAAQKVPLMDCDKHTNKCWRNFDIPPLFTHPHILMGPVEFKMLIHMETTLHVIHICQTVQSM